jgi:hypothetical protein
VCYTNKETNERTNERTKKQTNERTNERTNEQTNTCSLSIADFSFMKKIRWNYDSSKKVYGTDGRTGGRTDGRMYFWLECTLFNGSTRTTWGNLALLTHITDTVRWNTPCKVAVLALFRVTIRDIPDKTTGNDGKPQGGQLMCRSRIEMDTPKIQIVIFKLNYFIKFVWWPSVCLFVTNRKPYSFIKHAQWYSLFWDGEYR